MRGVLSTSVTVKDVSTVEMRNEIIHSISEKISAYVLIGKEIVIHEEKADVVRSIFDDYLAGASLGKIVDLLFKKGVVSPTGKVKWTRAAVDKLLANKKYIPLVGIKIYMDTQFEKARRCNVDYDKAGYPRKAVRYQSPVFDTK